MIRSWFKAVFSAFLRGSAIAIHCLFSCFRLLDDDDAREPVVVSRNQSRLYSVLPCEEKQVSPCEDKERHGDIEVGELNDEAKLPKGCGSLPRTPAEILKVSEEVKNSTPHDGESESSKIQTLRLQNASIRNLNLDNQPEEPPTPTKLSEEWANTSGSLSRTPCSMGNSSSSTQNNGDGRVINTVQYHANQSKTSPASMGDLVATVQSKNKSVRFKCDSSSSSFSSKSSSSESGSQSTEQSETAGDHSVSKPSPYPTPLKLTDEMQTPGTVFPSYPEIAGNGKNNPRIRSQYVYSVTNPMEIFSLPKKVLNEEEDYNGNQLRVSIEQADDESTPKSKVGMSEGSLEKGLKVEPSLACWLRASPANQNGNNKHLFGTPNLATKYKEEDEKVDLQATPFQERLENALSGETFIS